MYSGKALAEKAKAASERQALQMRAFDRVIGKQLDVASKKAAEAGAKKVDSEEVYRAKLSQERERAQKKVGKKLSAAHLKMAQETGLSGAVVARMIGVEEGGSSSSSGDESDGSGSGRRKRKKSKKDKKDKKKKSKKDKKEKKKKSKKDKKDKKTKKGKRRRDEADAEGEGGASGSGSEESG
ncbi:hypothetical protein TrRE_jg5816, partial [Triparma retinervis]